MAIQIQGYNQRIDLGSNVGTPGVKPNVTNSGVGESLERLGSEAMRAVANYERSQRESAETESLSAASETRLHLEQKYREAQEQAQPGADQFTPNFQKYFDTTVNDRATKLTNDEARKRYRERMIGVQNDMIPRAMTWEAGERVAKRTNDFRTSAEANANSVYTVDGQNRDLTYQNVYQDMDGSLDAIGLPPSTRDQLREEIKTKMSYAAVQGDLRDRPDKVQDWLVKGSGSGYFSRLRGAESGGRNIGSDTSSAFGPYQFTSGTWKSVVKSHPELGLTEADRFKPAAQEVAIRAFTQDNANALTKAGIKVTDTNLYMAHFLGSGGAVHFIRAFEKNPNDDARAHAAPASVAANPGVFRPGRTVGEVMANFGNKFGDKISWDKGSDAPSYYTDIPFSKRDALYSAAETEMNKRRVAGEAAFAQRVQNSVSEFASTGVATSPPTEQEFLAAMGPNRGGVAYGEFQANSQAAQAAFNLQRMPLNEQTAFVESLKPQRGDPFFAEKSAGYEKVKVAADAIRQRVLTDFGHHVVSGNDEARKMLGDAFNTEIPQEQAMAAASRYAQIMDSEANRLNVPASARSLLPKAYSDSISAQLNQKLTTDGNAYAAVGALNAYAQRWGNNWPRVYREMKDTLSAPVQVITSGIQPKAAVVLASVHDKSFDELTKSTMLPADKKALQDDLQEAFRPYLTSTMWQQSSLPGVGIFFEQAKKLAAVYVGQGQSASDAASAAYNDLLGFKYRMIDVSGVNVRVPRVVDTPDMETLLRVERGNVINSDRIAVMAGEAKNDPDAVGRLRNRLEREAKWVTTPDDKGVALMVQNQIRSDAQGKPLFYSWEQLKTNLERYKTEAKENADDRTFWGWSFD